MTLEEVKQKIETANAQSDKLNKERQTNIGRKETYTAQLKKAFEDYKKAYGVELTVDSLTAELERVKAAKEKELALVEGMIACINAGDYNGARQLAGEPIVENNDSLSATESTEPIMNAPEDTTETTNVESEPVAETKPKRKGRPRKKAETEETVAEPSVPTPAVVEPSVPTPVATPTPTVAPTPVAPSVPTPAVVEPNVPTPVVAPTPVAPSVPTPSVPTPVVPSVPTPVVAPTPSVPTPTVAPTPVAPSVPAPVVAPTPVAPSVPTPVVAPTPSVPTPVAPSVPTPPVVPTPSVPTPTVAPTPVAPNSAVPNVDLGAAPAPEAPTNFQQILGMGAFNFD